MNIIGWTILQIFDTIYKFSKVFLLYYITVAIYSRIMLKIKIDFLHKMRI
jgi:hypothetical protein